MERDGEATSPAQLGHDRFREADTVPSTLADASVGGQLPSAPAGCEMGYADRQGRREVEALLGTVLAMSGRCQPAVEALATQGPGVLSNRCGRSVLDATPCLAVEAWVDPTDQAAASWGWHMP